MLRGDSTAVSVSGIIVDAGMSVGGQATLEVGIVTKIIPGLVSVMKVDTGMRVDGLLMLIGGIVTIVKPILAFAMTLSGAGISIGRESIAMGGRGIVGNGWISYNENALKTRGLE